VLEGRVTEFHSVVMEPVRLRMKPGSPGSRNERMELSSHRTGRQASP
jgi:hypothetical protein